MSAEATVVAYSDVVAGRTATGPWGRSAAPAEQGGSPFLRVATFVGEAKYADRRQWIAFKNASGQLSVAHMDAVSWIEETAVAQTTYGAAVAIDSVGIPVAVSAGVDGIVLARRSGVGMWIPATVASIAGGARNVALAMNAFDPFIAWHDPTTGMVMFAHSTGPTSFATEPIASAGTFYHDDTIAIAIDAVGNPHVAYKASNDIVHATRAGGVWTTETLPLVSVPIIIPQFGSVRIAVARSGVVAVGVAGDVISVSTSAGGGWFTQPVTARCRASKPGFDMAYDSSSTLSIVHSCGDDVTFMTHVGNYPPGYDATCNQVATTACNTACTCPHTNLMGDDLCCLNKGSLGDCTSPSNIADCANHYAVALCGDATQDPSFPATCSAALAAPTCDPPDASTPGLELPAGCPAPPP
jgi:hypothetical protein